MNVGEFYCIIEYSEDKDPIWNIRGCTELERCLGKVRQHLLSNMNDVVEIYHFHHGEMIFVERFRGSNASCDANCMGVWDSFEYNDEVYGLGPRR